MDKLARNSINAGKKTILNQQSWAKNHQFLVQRYKIIDQFQQALISFP